MVLVKIEDRHTVLYRIMLYSIDRHVHTCISVMRVRLRSCHADNLTCFVKPVNFTNFTGEKESSLPQLILMICFIHPLILVELTNGKLA